MRAPHRQSFESLKPSTQSPLVRPIQEVIMDMDESSSFGSSRSFDGAADGADIAEDIYYLRWMDFSGKKS